MVGVITAQQQIEKVNPLTDPDWDAWLLTHPDHTVFHAAKWARVLHESYGYEPTYFAVRDPDRLKALFPLMGVESWLTERRGVGLPFSDFCPPLLSEDVPFTELFREAQARGTVRFWRHLEWRGGPDRADPAASYYGHEIDLAPDEDRLFAQCHSSIRRGIRKARESGVEVAIRHDAEAVGAFYRLHCRTRRKHALPPQPWKFFARLHEQMLVNDKGFVVVASYKNRPIAGAIFLRLGLKAVFKFGASDARHQSLRPNNLVMWEAIRRLRRTGADSLHLGRTDLDDEGLRAFKQRWGAQEHMIHYYRYDLQKRGYVSAESSNGQPKAAAGLFRYAPIALNRALGSIAYRHLG